jgi:CheY-like chemotaxis protein
MSAKLLLADDSVTIQRVIELTFADEDVQVFTVGDGRAAIEQIQRDRPDIVLADVGMPERDGYEVAAFVKGTPELAGIPVLLLTGAFEPIDEGRARTAGCDGVLVKPFEPQTVISRVRDLLAGRRPEGLWSAGPAASAAPARPASPSHEDRSPVAQPSPAPSGSLEDYFDRLDAAFATLEGGQAPSSFAPVPSGPPVPAPSTSGPRGVSPVASGAFADEFVGWNPDMAGGPSARAAAPSPEPSPEPASGTRPPTLSRADVTASSGPRLEVPAGTPPTLGEAFAALLAAEQGQSFAPGARAATAPVPPEAIDDAVRRVLDGMTAQTVRDTVLDVAERLVREEIERIKSATPRSS